MKRKKNPHAAALGRRAMVTMTAAERSRRARKAAQARWASRAAARPNFRLEREFAPTAEAALETLDALTNAPAVAELLNAPSNAEEGGKA